MYKNAVANAPLPQSSKMKLLVLVLCGLAVATANEKWEDFKKTHGKTYATATEESHRRSVFEEKLKFNAEHNARYEQGLETFTVGINKLSDMTQDEIVNTMMGLSKDKLPVRKFHNHHSSGKALLNEWDWREQDMVTPVKDQGQCGSCWAFSTTGSLEGVYGQTIGYVISLSEQDLNDCSGDWGNGGCNGGWPQFAFEYIMDVGGINSEQQYPYLAYDASCAHDEHEVGATCSDYADVPTADEVALQDAVQNIGPVSISIDASWGSFGSYSSGVYYEPNCEEHGLNHAVLAVGFGEENGQEYWLVKNSWGTSWGEDGYIKMARNKDNNCGVASSACYPII